MQVSLNTTAMMLFCIGLIICIAGVFGLGKSQAECESGKTKDVDLNYGGGVAGIVIGIIFIVVASIAFALTKTDQYKDYKFDVKVPFKKGDKGAGKADIAAANEFDSVVGSEEALPLYEEAIKAFPRASPQQQVQAQRQAMQPPAYQRQPYREY